MQTLKLHGVPGGGKTYTLLKYFEEELKTVSPKKIGFLTFTRAARHEALSRASLSEEELPYVKTIHATCYSALGMDQSQLVKRQDIIDFGRKLGVHLTGFMPDMFGLESVTTKFQKPTKADMLLQLNHLGRHRGFDLRETLRNAPAELDFNYAKWFTQAYRAWKTSTGQRDYTDLLQDYISVGDPLDLEILFVDEAQDLSWLQWRVVHKLGANCRRIYLCGDPDQAIFVWAGASSSLFDLEPADEVRSLPHSYRVPRVVHGIADKIIHRVKTRFEKSYTCRDEEGEYRPVGRLDLPHLQDKKTLVLYRNFHRGLSLGLQLEELGVPYNGFESALSQPEVISCLSGLDKLSRHEPLEMNEAKALVVHGNPQVLLDGAADRVKRETGNVSGIELYNNPFDVLKLPISRITPKLPRLAYLQRVVAKYGIAGAMAPTITLMSIHQSKGREADTVILDLDMARKTYEGYMKDPDDEERVFYVAVTRARRRLLTLLPTEQLHYKL